MTAALQAELLHTPSSQATCRSETPAEVSSSGLLAESQHINLLAHDQPGDEAALLGSQTSASDRPDSMQKPAQDQSGTAHRSKRRIKTAWPEFAKHNIVAPLPLADVGLLPLPDSTQLQALESMQAQAVEGQGGWQATQLQPHQDTLPVALAACCRSVYKQLYH